MKRRGRIVTQQDWRRDRHAMTHSYANEQRMVVEFWKTPLNKQVRGGPTFETVKYVKEVVT